MTQERDEEVLVKGGHDCWVVARQTGQQELHLVLEGRGDGGLLEAAEDTKRFMQTHMHDFDA